MIVGMIDADLLAGGTRHPNLAQMKMSAYCREKGHDVRLVWKKDDLEHPDSFDLLLVSKVFDFNPLPPVLEKMVAERGGAGALNGPLAQLLFEYDSRRPDHTLIQVGGTGFFPDGGRDLDPEIEHHLPDYSLYMGYVNESIKAGKKRSYFNDYIQCAVGFVSRGCFRKCGFCVNRKYDHAEVSMRSLDEIVAPDSRFMNLWDDNFLALGRRCLHYLDILDSAGIPYQFRQGLDLRLMTDEYAGRLAHSHHSGDYIFAFDHIQDRPLITEKLALWRRHTSAPTKLYVLCAYDPVAEDEKYRMPGDMTRDEKDREDIRGMFERIRIAMRYQCLPYIMRYDSYKESRYRGIYTQVARWCNQPGMIRTMSFRQFCELNQKSVRTGRIGSAMAAFGLLERELPDVAAEFADIRYRLKGESSPVPPGD